MQTEVDGGSGKYPDGTDLRYRTLVVTFDHGVGVDGAAVAWTYYCAYTGSDIPRAVPWG